VLDTHIQPGMLIQYVTALFEFLDGHCSVRRDRFVLVARNQVKDSPAVDIISVIFQSHIEDDKPGKLHEAICYHVPHAFRFSVHYLEESFVE
jgi:hypothetical protein